MITKFYSRINKACFLPTIELRAAELVVKLGYTNIYGNPIPLYTKRGFPQKNVPCWVWYDKL